MNNVKNHIKSRLGTIKENYDHLSHSEPDDEIIHQIRVSIRQLNPIIMTLYKLENSGNKDTIKYYHKILNSLFNKLSYPRDVDVQINLALNLQKDIDDFHSDFNEYINFLNDEKLLVTSQLSNSIDKEPLGQAIQYFNEYADEFSFSKDKLIKVNRLHIKERKQQLKEAISQLNQCPENFHKARIKLKKLRYSIELKQLLTDKKASHKILLLKKSQDKLGYTHDLYTSLKMMDLYKLNNNLIERVKEIYQTNLNQSCDYLINHRSRIL